MTRLSAIEFSIISQSLLSVPKEMGAKLIESSFSTIIREARDCSAAILDDQGRVVAQADQIPILLGSISSTFQSAMEYLSGIELEEGDFIITNDPYSGGQHIQDVFIFFPIFSDKKIVGYSATIAHHLDLGGASAGISATANDVFGEGLRFPPIRLNLERDWYGGAFERLLTANVRVPDLTIGDFDAQFAANQIGQTRVLQLVEKYGLDKVRAAYTEMLDYSERMMRASIGRVPDGVYTGEDFVDDDGIGTDPLPVRVTLSVKDDEISVDFTGTSPQVSRNLNSPFASTVSAVLCCLKTVLTDLDVQFNDGSSRPIHISAPAGTLVNPHSPAPVRARLEACYRAYNAVMIALSEVLPDKVAAPGFDTLTVASLSRLSDKKYSVYLEVFGGGNGATQRTDGCNAVDSPLSNCTNTPVESADKGYDFFRVLRYSLVQDSCGHGKMRGGLGFLKEYEILSDGVTVALYGDRFRIAPKGLFGGGNGTTGACFVTRGNEIIELRSKDQFELRKGDRLTFRLGGGGGYGDPAQRSHELIHRDIEAGYLSREVARSTYAL